MPPLPRFESVTVHEAPLADGIACESRWLAEVAARGAAVAHLWHAPQGLIATRSYERLGNWSAACSASAAAGWPVEVRTSGGGLVPQGPGLLNVSLLWRGDPMPIGTDGIYKGLCATLARALAQLAIVATPSSVPGSFCDGRYNLAVNGRKLVGTAQAWKKILGQPVVLAHAVIIVDAAPEVLCAAANGFEAALGTGRRYRAAALTSVALACRAAGGAVETADDPRARLVAAVVKSLERGFT